MTSPFNSLEAAVIKAIADQYPMQKSAILAQFDAASVVSRENSGGGFFVDLKVDRAKAEPVVVASPIGYVFARISGFKHPMEFLVFVKDSYATLLEGYCQGDDETSSVDFATVEFTLFDLSSVGEM